MTNTPSSTPSGFKFVRSVQLPELQSTLIELVHMGSGAQVMHIANDDPENVFCLSFKTLPNSSNGVAHILEHTVLCGSKKFPIKDPFFAMSRRSLNTFMNALTGSDFTCYPAASQIKKDFYNLLDVYLDAVFFPNLKLMSFKQEGHRLEFESPSDPASPLQFKGVVYNEMKGAMNSASSRLHEAMNKALLPDLTYSHNSGGDPSEIPSLTYEELLSFHHAYYHPSRCLFYFYGNLPLKEHLEFIEERVLKDIQPLPPLPPVPFQAKYHQPIYVETAYPVSSEDELQKKTDIAFAWLTCPMKEQLTALSLLVLEVILLDSDASPLKKALLKSGLCKQVGAYIDTEMSEAPFSIVCKGSDADQADKLETILFETLKEIDAEGISEEAIESAIHQLEFHRSEITGDDYPFGLNLFLRSGLLKQHGGEPESGLLVHKLCDDIRSLLKTNPRYFCDLISIFLIHNPHFVRVVMKPDPLLEGKERTNEEEKLKAIKKNLSSEQVKALIKEAADLKVFQKEQETEKDDILPKVTLEDVPLQLHDFPLSLSHVSGWNLYHHPSFTNHISYVDIAFDLPSLRLQEMINVRLLTLCLPQLGCGEGSYEQTLNRMQAHTGGVAAYINFFTQAHNPNDLNPAFMIRGKALYRKGPELGSLLNDLIHEPHFNDPGRLKEILFKHESHLTSSLPQQALKYALNLATSYLTPASLLSSELYGLSYYHYIKRLCTKWEENIGELTKELSHLYSKIVHCEADMVLGCDAEGYEEWLKNDLFGLKSMKGLSPLKYLPEFKLPPPPYQARKIASPVAFIAKTVKTIPYVHPDSPFLSLAAHLFDNMVLHPKIREEGGAYGGGAVNAFGGCFYFYSYRDPHIAKTLLTFDEAVQEILQGQFTPQDLEEAKLEMIQHMDAPLAPGTRAQAAYGWMREGKNASIRQAFRERLLQARSEDVQESIKKHLLPELNNYGIVLFGGESLILKENEVLKAQGLKPFPVLSIDE